LEDTYPDLPSAAIRTSPKFTSFSNFKPPYWVISLSRMLSSGYIRTRAQRRCWNHSRSWGMKRGVNNCFTLNAKGNLSTELTENPLKLPTVNVEEQDGMQQEGDLILSHRERFPPGLCHLVSIKAMVRRRDGTEKQRVAVLQVLGTTCTCSLKAAGDMHFGVMKRGRRPIERLPTACCNSRPQRWHPLAGRPDAAFE
jgi:hypothetical protein